MALALAQRWITYAMRHYAGIVMSGHFPLNSLMLHA